MKVGLFGANGRMGRVLIEALNEHEQASLSVASVRDDSPWVGMDVGELAGIGKLNTACEGVSGLNPDDVDVMIDFTLPAAFDSNLAWCVKHKKPVVIGTTGLSDAQLTSLADAAKSIPVVFAANYSVGVNLMLSLVKQAARALGSSADIEIIEAHHRFKQDSPSGTAMAIGEAIADELGRDLKTCAVYGREGKEPPRDHNTIGFATVRAGDVVGEHTALFADIGERLEIYSDYNILPFDYSLTLLSLFYFKVYFTKKAYHQYRRHNTNYSEGGEKSKNSLWRMLMFRIRVLVYVFKAKKWLPNN